MVRTHISEHLGAGAMMENGGKGLTPKHLTKEEFARRVYRLMVQRGWTQSDLARHAGLPRDAISVYVRAKSLPTPVNLAELAACFNMKPEELLPNIVETAIDNDQPAFEMRASTAAPGKVWLRVNRAVSMATAVKIAELLEQDDTVLG